MQDAVEVALARIHGAPLATVAAGRTDAGVHALGQVLHFDVLHARPEQAWVRGVNALLPAGVGVLWAREIDAAFHARYAAVERVYRYVLLNHPVRPALLAGRVGWLHAPLDDAAMIEAAACLVGRHDFSAFRAAACQARTPVRELRTARVERHGRFLVFEFAANAFLHHQVRNMVGALAWVGLGRRPPVWLREVLESRDRSLAAATFAPDGLYLAAVRYASEWGLPESAGRLPWFDWG